jgi:two-component system OmpR family response regulator
MADDPSGTANLGIVVIEDDVVISGLITKVLSAEGHSVAASRTAADGFEAIRTSEPDVVVLDLGLPDMDGTAVIRRLRAEGDRVGIVCVTARTDEIDRVLGFELGADDYVTKPFSPRELAGRVRALGRRVRRLAGPADAERLEFGGVVVDVGRKEVSVLGEPIATTPMERDLIEYLARNRGLAVSRLQILEAVWGHDWLGESRTVDMHVAQIRRKLGSAADISTVRGVGYRLE